METFPAPSQRASAELLPDDRAADETPREFVDGEDRFPFFNRGREFEPATTSHVYTAEEERELGKFESIDYLPPLHMAYRQWLQRHIRSHATLKWVMMGLVGFVAGLVAYVVRTVVHLGAELRLHRAVHLVEEGHLFMAWLWLAGVSVVIVMGAAALIVFYRPVAGGSGIEEMIGYLNGTKIHKILNVHTFIAKLFSTALAAASGLPLGPEGPMIHMGAIVGAGLTQGQSRTFGWNLFSRFRNSRDKRDFLSAGAAAGVAAAFGAPVGGLLFAMEEVSSFWDQQLTIQIFFSAMVSTFTADFFSSAFKGFHYSGDLGRFDPKEAVVFQVSTNLSSNILMVPPTLLLGVMGGLLGAAFTFFNIKINRLRRRYLTNRRALKFLEPCLLIVLWVTVRIYLPTVFSCIPAAKASVSTVSKETLDDLVRESCDKGHVSNATYNPAASLFLTDMEGVINQLLSRRSHFRFGYPELLALLALYTPFSCLAAGTSVASGIVEPMLVIGATMGRVVGVMMVDVFGVHADSVFWEWLDPGAFALIGAAAFFAGVSRLTVSLTVIMIEITGELYFLLPIMLAIMVAKWVADSSTHSLYHALLEMKCIPFLPERPGFKRSMELYFVGDVMKSPVVAIHETESVRSIASKLSRNRHNAFPLLRNVTVPLPPAEGAEPPPPRYGAPAAEEGGQLQVFVGTVSRSCVQALLRRPELFQDIGSLRTVMEAERGGEYTAEEDSVPDFPMWPADASQSSVRGQLVHADSSAHVAPLLTYRETSTRFTYREHTRDAQEMRSTLQRLREEDGMEYKGVDLRPYVDRSAMSVRQDFSLERTYLLFRSLGLRHVVVVDNCNRVVGMVTRKDLLGHNIEARLLEADLRRGTRTASEFGV